MTPQAVLIELLDRVASLPSEKVLISNNELNQWPTDAVDAMKAPKLIRMTRPAMSVVCGECEKECTRPVHTVHTSSGEPRAFLICEERDDVNRVIVTVSQLEQWQTSASLVAELLTNLLGLITPSARNSTTERWEIGLFKGQYNTSHMVLFVGDELMLSLAGYSIALADVIAIDNGKLTIDRKKLIYLVDHPAAGAGDQESADQRGERILKRLQEVHAQGIRNFLQVVADEEGISKTRIKQIRDKYKSKTKDPATDWLRKSKPFSSK